jgi:hypothetical protein
LAANAFFYNKCRKGGSFQKQARAEAKDGFQKECLEKCLDSHYFHLTKNDAAIAV